MYFEWDLHFSPQPLVWFYEWKKMKNDFYIHLSLTLLKDSSCKWVMVMDLDIIDLGERRIMYQAIWVFEMNRSIQFLKLKITLRK